MAIKHRLTKLEKRLRPVEKMMVEIRDMVAIRAGLTGAQQEAFMENYRRERSELEDHVSGDKKVRSLKIVFVPGSDQRPTDMPRL